MFQFDPETGVLVLPLWMSAALVVVVIGLIAFALARGGILKTAGALLVLGAVASAAWIGGTVLEQRGGSVFATSGDRNDERRLFEQRVNELVGRSMLPGSALACLDGTAGEQVASGCERLIFGSPETISAAVSYVSMRLGLLADGMQMASASGANYENALAAIRQGVEADRFGIVAYLMLQNPDCKPEQCARLSLLRNPNKVRANLLDRPYDVLVARYSANWQVIGRSGDTHSGSAVTMTAPQSSSVPAISGAGAPASSRYDFPSANSIPPVSIMNSEPGAPGTAAPAAKEAATPPARAASAPPPTSVPKRPPPPRPARPAPSAAVQPQEETPAPPTQLAPSAAQR